MRVIKICLGAGDISSARGAVPRTVSVFFGAITGPPGEFGFGLMVTGAAEPKGRDWGVVDTGPPGFGSGLTITTGG